MTRSTFEVRLQRAPLNASSSVARDAQSAGCVTRDRKPRGGSLKTPKPQDTKASRARSHDQRSVCERFDGMSETVTMIPKRSAITRYPTTGPGVGWPIGSGGGMESCASAVEAAASVVAIAARERVRRIGTGYGKEAVEWRGFTRHARSIRCRARSLIDVRREGPRGSGAPRGMPNADAPRVIHQSGRRA